MELLISWIRSALAIFGVELSSFPISAAECSPGLPPSVTEKQELLSALELATGLTLTDCWTENGRIFVIGPSLTFAVPVQELIERRDGKV